MPRNQPVGLRRFVEINGPHGNWLSGKVRADEGERLGGVRKVGNRWESQNSPTTRSAGRAEFGEKLPPLFRPNREGNNVKSVGLDRFQSGKFGGVVSGFKCGDSSPGRIASPRMPGWMLSRAIGRCVKGERGARFME